MVSRGPGHGLHFRTDWVVILVVQLCLVGCSADYFWDGTEWVWKVSRQAWVQIPNPNWVLSPKMSYPKWKGQACICKQWIFDFGTNDLKEISRFYKNKESNPFSIIHYASRKVQPNMAHLFRSSKEHDERINDEWGLLWCDTCHWG